MIGAFARMFGSRERLLSYEETAENGYAVKARNERGEDSMAEAHDAPPDAFVQKISDEGGDVYVAPVLEALRRAFRRRKSPSDDGAASADDETVPRMPERAEALAEGGD